jgi:hypothetical protein
VVVELGVYVTVTKPPPDPSDPLTTNDVKISVNDTNSEVLTVSDDIIVSVSVVVLIIVDVIVTPPEKNVETTDITTVDSSVVVYPIIVDIKVPVSIIEVSWPPIDWPPMLPDDDEDSEGVFEVEVP